jgi:hypothetical protein
VRALLGRAWAFLRELSVEAALERRMKACRCGPGAGKAARDPVKAAWEEAFAGLHRCC